MRAGAPPGWDGVYRWVVAGRWPNGVLNLNDVLMLSSRVMVGLAGRAGSGSVPAPRRRRELDAGASPANRFATGSHRSPGEFMGARRGVRKSMGRAVDGRLNQCACRRSEFPSVLQARGARATACYASGPRGSPTRTGATAHRPRR